jgi:hypothetical protein
LAVWARTLKSSPDLGNTLLYIFSVFEGKITVILI